MSTQMGASLLVVAILAFVSPTATAQELLPPSVSGPGTAVVGPAPIARSNSQPLVTRVYQLGPSATETANWLAMRNGQTAFARQLAVQDQVRWLAGLPGLFSDVPGPSLDYVYSGLGVPGVAPSGWPTANVFEPWPVVPGDIYGAQYYRRTPQPIGHQITPTGPNGYTYSPIYAAPPSVPTAQPVALSPASGLREF